MIKPRAKQRGAFLKAYSISLYRERLAELFSRLFYVAASRLNSPRLFRRLLKHRDPVLSSATSGVDLPQLGQLQNKSRQDRICGDGLGSAEDFDFAASSIDVDSPFIWINQPA